MISMKTKVLNLVFKMYTIFLIIIALQWSILTEKDKKPFINITKWHQWSFARYFANQEEDSSFSKILLPTLLV